MHQGAGQGQYILHRLAIPQAFDLDGAKAQPRGLQLRHDRSQVSAAAHQDRHLTLGKFAARVRHQAHDFVRFARSVVLGQGMQLHRRTGRRRLCRVRRGIRHGAHRHVFPRWQYTGERAIDPIDDAALGTEIHPQRKRREPHAADAFAPRTQIQADLRFAEAVDGLHGIAHGEQRASVPCAPTGGEAFEQSVLTQGRVLELIHQEMAQTIVQRQRQIRRLLRLPQGEQRCLGDLGEIHLAVLLKRKAQLRHGEGQQGHEGLQQRPLVVAVHRRR